MNNSNNKYWFKRRRYSYGWTPASTKGWSVVAIYLLAVTAGAYLISGKLSADSSYYLVAVLLATTVLMYVTTKKGPKLRWRWGRKDTDNPDEDF